MAGSAQSVIAWFTGLAPLYQGLMIAAVVVALLLLAMSGVIGAGMRRLRQASAAGRRASALAAEVIPSTNFARDGRPCDPLNMRIVGDADQLSAAFVSAGWYRADEITLVTSARISLDAVFGRKYSTAPVSDLYLFGRKQDFAFEKPGRTVRERDHVRFWRNPIDAVDGRPLWIGGATRDAKVELSKTNHLPTHGIAPDVDDERALIVGDLIHAGWVIAEEMVASFPGPTQRKNAMGDPFHTDGKAAHLTLVKAQPVPLVARLVRRGSAPLARRIARLFRPTLPKEGREFARKWEERRRLAAQQGASPASQPPASGA